MSKTIKRDLGTILKTLNKGLKHDKMIIVFNILKKIFKL